MKNFILQMAGVFALLCWVNPGLNAQNNASEGGEVIIIQKIENEDGAVTTVKRRIRAGENVQPIIKDLEDAEGRNLEFHLLSDDSVNEAPKAEEGEAIFLFRRGKAPAGAGQMDKEGMKHELENMKIILHGDVEPGDYHFNWRQGADGGEPHLRPEPALKAFLGVYPGHAEGGAGVKLDGIVAGGPAEAAGLQQGDVVTAIGGQATNGEHGLRGVLGGLQAGETVAVQYLRGGQPMEVQLTLGEKEYTRWVLNEERNPCKVFIGVYVGGQASAGRGVQVTGIIGKTPAEAAGLQSGDIILAMDGVPVNNNEELLAERDKHEPGQEFTLSVLRNGQEMKFDTRFLICTNEQQEQQESIVEQPQAPAPLEMPDNTLELQDFKTFPNPAFSYVNVQFRAEPVPTLIQLADASGRIVFQRQLSNFDGYFNEEIGLRDATPGTLTLTVRQGDKLVARQLVLLNRA